MPEVGATIRSSILVTQFVARNQQCGAAILQTLITVLLASKSKRWLRHSKCRPQVTAQEKTLIGVGIRSAFLTQCDASLDSPALILGYPRDRTRILGTGLRQIFSQRIPICEV